MALASPYPDVEIPDLSVPEFVLAAGKERPDAPALIDGVSGETITHGQLAAPRRPARRRAARDGACARATSSPSSARTPSGTRSSSTASPPPAA